MVQGARLPRTLLPSRGVAITEPHLLRQIDRTAQRVSSDVSRPLLFMHMSPFDAHVICTRSPMWLAFIPSLTASSSLSLFGLPGLLGLLGLFDLGPESSPMAFPALLLAGRRAFCGPAGNAGHGVPSSLGFGRIPLLSDKRDIGVDVSNPSVVRVARSRSARVSVVRHDWSRCVLSSVREAFNAKTAQLIYLRRSAMIPPCGVGPRSWGYPDRRHLIYSDCEASWIPHGG